MNWNTLSDGSHPLRVLIDGVQFTEVTFHVANLGAEFLQGIDKRFMLTNFPQAGTDSVLRWSEPAQNFVIEQTVPSGSGVGDTIILTSHEEIRGIIFDAVVYQTRVEQCHLKVTIYE
jgi:hypothetical protein